jgi:hypothetical protein
VILPVLFGLVFVAVGGFIIVRGSAAPRLAYTLVRTRTGRVSDLMGGYPDRICLVGTVEAIEGSTVQAPFTGRECVALDYEVQEFETTHNAANNTSSSSWETIHGGSTDRPFTLADGSGRVRVNPAGAYLSLDVDDRIEVDGGERPPERIRRYIQVSDAVDSEDTSFDIGPFSLSTGEDRRYVERRLEPGDDVLVLGKPVQARGEVGMVNAEVRGAPDAPFLVGDGGRGTITGRLVIGSLVSLLFGLVFAAIGLFAVFVGLQSGVGLGPF